MDPLVSGYDYVKCTDIISPCATYSIFRDTGGTLYITVANYYSLS